ncbi:MAG: tetratricopeptide repeat protein, partial [Planctomycetota bacterium]
SDHPGMFLALVGEAGSGKSALMDWLVGRVRSAGQREIRGYAQGAEGQPIKVFHDLLRELLGVVELEHTEESLREFAGLRLAEYLGEDSATASYFVSFLLGEEPEELSPEMRQYCWFRLFSAVASETPLVLLVDDLHEADLETLARLRELLERFRHGQVPVIVIGTSLPLTTQMEKSRRQALAPLLEEGGRESLVLPIEDLEKDAVESLIDTLYPGTSFRDNTPWLADAILHRSAGNAAFVMELVRGLSSDNGHPALFERQESGDARQIGVLTYDQILAELPVHFSDSLERRLATLPKEYRPVVEYAALIGPEFPAAVLEHVISDVDILDNGLDRLEADGFLEATDADASRYRFTNAVVPEIVVARLTQTARRAVARKRAQIAEALIAEFGDSPRQSERIGRMLAGARRFSEAYPHLLRALKVRIGRGQYSDALSLIDRMSSVREGMEMLPVADDLEFKLLEGRVMSALGRPEEALKTAKSAYQTAERVHDEEYQITCLLLLSEIQVRSAHIDQASKYAEDALARAEGSVLSAKNNLGIIRLMQRRYDEAREVYTDTLSLLPEKKDLSRQRKILHNLGIINFRTDRYPEAQDCFTRAIEVAEELGNLDHATISRVGLSNVKFTQGHLDEARIGYQEAIETFRRLQNRSGLAVNYSNVAEVDILLGKLDIALESIGRSIEIFQEIGDRTRETMSRITKGEILEMFGDLEQAWQEQERALELSRETGDRELEENAALRKVLLALMRGELLDLGRVHDSRKSSGAEFDIELRALHFLLECRQAIWRNDCLSTGRLAAARECYHELVNIPYSVLRCTLAAAVALASPDPEGAAQDLCNILSSAGTLPSGAPVDMIHNALAKVLVSSDPERADQARLAAQRAVEARAGQIEDDEIRQRFLDTHGYETS